MIHDLIDRFFSSPLMRKIMSRERTPRGLQELRIEGKGYLRFASWGDWYGVFLEYREIWVEKAERQKGWGSKLMAMLVEEAKKRGLSEIYVRADTDGKSDVLGKFITKNGFLPIGNEEKEEYRRKEFGFTFKKTI